MKKEVQIKANKLYEKKLHRKIIKIAFLLLIIIMSFIYLILYILNENGGFTVSIDRNLYNRKSVYLSEDGTIENKTIKLTAESIQNMDNISIKWLPANIDTEKTGVHNGDNYIAYTFYVVNSGKETLNYWYEIDIDDKIRNVDEAIRIMIIKNGKKIVYAKKNKETGFAEENTKKFVSKSIAVLEQRKKFKPNEKDRYTIVVWIEGDDPDCKNDLLGGALKMHMDISEEHLKKKK